MITDANLARGGCFEPLTDSDWDGAPHRLLLAGTGINHAVRVALAGRKVRYDVPRLRGEGVVRVDITLVGDGEPDQVVKGWARATGWGSAFTLMEDMRS